MAKAKILEFRRIDVMSLAKIASLLGVIVGLIAGIGLAFISSASIPGMEQFMIPASFGMASIVFMPILYGIIYFISGALTAIIYNVLAGKIGGIKVTTN